MANHYEHDEQSALFSWAKLHEAIYPELKWMFAVPNSARRSPRQGAWMKAEGLKSGVWDIFLPLPIFNDHKIRRGARGGLFIEMKSGKNKLTPQQVQFRDNLEKYYDFVVCYTWVEARAAIIRYIDEERF